MSTLQGSLAECIAHATRSSWSGRIEVRDAHQVIGEIRINNGQFSWATCRDQTETLGTYLWRWGRITKEQLKTVQREYAAHKGKKKLATVISDLCFMDNSRLRRCLLHHIRTAAEGILSAENTTATMSAASAGDPDEQFLFWPDEILPVDFSLEDLGDPTPVKEAPEKADRTSEPAVFSPAVSSLAGFLSAALISRSGRVLAYEGEAVVLRVEHLAEMLPAIMDTASEGIAQSCSGELETLMLDTGEASPLIYATPTQNDFFIMLFIGDGGDDKAIRETLGQEARNVSKNVRIAS